MASFQEIPTSRSVPERELEIQAFWEKENIYHKQVEQNQKGPLFVFYEGPPTANGRPGIHHVLSRVFKDIYIRFNGQKGCHIPRMAGWDCHGLPVEREVEKELGIKAKSEIETEVGLEKFNEMCRSSVQKYVGEWKSFSSRLGFFIDLDHAYFTMENSYIESVWSLLKIIWEKGLIYQGYKVVPFDPVMGATMSDAEVALGYKTVEDPSLTVRFNIEHKLFDGRASILVWTTTPWTLPSNVALAVHPEESYVLIEREIPEKVMPTNEQSGATSNAKHEGTGKKKKGKKGQGSNNEPLVRGSGTWEKLICAEALVEKLFEQHSTEFKVVKKFTGKDLSGLSYEPLLDWVSPEEGKRSHFILNADFVTMDTGTGIVHIAPAYGADDLEVGNANDLPVLHAVESDGKFVEGTPLEGTFFKDADPQIIKLLKERGQVWKSEKYSHEYPFGWRTGAPLMYFAKDAWYIRTTSIRNELIENNNTIRWVPGHIKQGRFGNWLENNRDWALSRERYWGTPLPVWTDGEGNFRIVGSRKELQDLAGKDLSDLDLHRPYVDEVEFQDPDTGKTMRRVPEVIDAWFDSGSMPYAQWGYPVTGESDFKKYFPADFISEAIDQTRGWFYTLLAVSTMVSGKASFKNVVCLGHVLDEKGEKMSKSKGNIVPPQDVFDHHGADAIRWHFLTGAPAGNSRRIGMPGVQGDPLVPVHGFFNMVVNSVNFFTMYANVDGVELVEENGVFHVKGAPEFADRPGMDRWILSSLQNLVRDVTEALEDYDSQRGGKRIEQFTDSLSNWYIRRNRRRFWKGELDADKLAAYDTLHTCLGTIGSLLAPYIPFLSESVYRSIVAAALPDAPISVHLAPWPKADFKNNYDEAILREGDLVQQAASLGRTARQQSGVKVRQPLSRLMIHVSAKEDRQAIERNRDVLLEELNVKEIEYLDDSAGILDYRVKPNLPVLGKRLGSRLREVQEYFKNANGSEIAATIRSGGVVEIPAKERDDQEQIVLNGDEVLVESVSKEGTSGVEGPGMLVAVDTELTPELIQEGVVRDLIRNIQELRKNSGLNITDRIELILETKSREIEEAIQGFGSFLEEETLAKISKKIDSNKKPDGVIDLGIEDESVKISLYKMQ